MKTQVRGRQACIKCRAWESQPWTRNWAAKTSAASPKEWGNAEFSRRQNGVDQNEGWNAGPNVQNSPKQGVLKPKRGHCNIVKRADKQIAHSIRKKKNVYQEGWVAGRGALAVWVVFWGCGAKKINKLTSKKQKQTTTTAAQPKECRHTDHNLQQDTKVTKEEMGISVVGGVAVDGRVKR